MNIEKINKDDLNASITVSIEKTDYEPRVEKKIREYRQKANMPGFRPGMVPTGLIKKLYGKQILLEEINSLLSESLSSYIMENKLPILGEPIPNITEQKTIDWDNDNTYDFVFDVGFAPDFELELSQKDKINFYSIEPEEKSIDEHITSLAGRYGKYIDKEAIEGEEFIRADLSELDENGAPKEDGISVSEASIMVNIVKDEDVKKDFLGKKVGDRFPIDLKKAFENTSEIASMLKTDKKKVEKIESEFMLIIKQVSSYIPSEINQELFDKIFGENVVKSEEEFRQKIREELKKNLEMESDYKFYLDAREKLIEKTNLSLPDKFLKRFLLSSNNNDKLTPEKLEEDYPKYQEQFKWELIKNKIVKDQKIDISQDEMMQYAKHLTRMQFRQYGMNYIPDEYLENYATQTLESEDERRRIAEKILEDKVVKHIRESVKINTKEVSMPEFEKILSKNK
ncbi:MAG: trigger factor [Bacteroidota bacterium]